MPDAYGNPTPQEVVMLMQKQARESFLQAQQYGGPGTQAGASLAAIFGGTIKKTLDTRRAREAEATRLQKTQGLSREQAMDQAKSTVGREHAEVRRARKIQDATNDVQGFIEGLPEDIPMDMRVAHGKLFLSNRLRSMGMTSEANNLAAMANEELLKAEQAFYERENLKARTRASTASAVESETRVPYIGATDFMKNVLQKESIIAKLQDPNSQLTPEQRDSLLRAKGHLEAKILKDETILGRTPDDVKADPVLMRQLFADIADNQVLIANIDEAVAQFSDLDNFERSFWGGLAKDGLAFMERYFNRRPTESEQEFMTRVQEKEGKASLIAAKVRHALTGAQMSAFEIGYLTPFLPSPDDSVEVALSKLQIVRDYTQLDSDVRMTMFKQGLLDTWAKGVGAGQIPTSPSAPAAPGVTDETGALSALDDIIKSREQSIGR